MANEFEVIEIVIGRPKADILRSLLEANSIPVELSQESVGATTGFTIGPISEVRILVPKDKVELAKVLVEDFYKGNLQ